MNPSVLVTGGTGTLGSSVVPRILDTGRAAVLIGRRDHAPRDGIGYVRADLSEPSSVPLVAAALDGVDTVMHLAGGPKGDDVKTRHLLDAIRSSGRRPHLIYISVVGADRTPVVGRVDRAVFGYFKTKYDSEHLIAATDLPTSVVRASQFHTFVGDMALAVTKLPIAVVPAGMRMQPIDVDEVAVRLIDIARSGPTGETEEMAGPAVHGADELVRSYLRAVGRRRAVINVRLPGKAAAAFREGVNLNPARAVGRRTWEQFIADVAPTDVRVA